MAEHKSTLRICVMSIEEMKAYSLESGRKLDVGIESRDSLRAFATQELLWKKLTPKRLEILNAMVGAGPISIRELARRVARDVKAVHGDVHVLLQEKVIVRTDGGQIELPFDEVRLEVAMKSKAAA